MKEEDDDDHAKRDEHLDEKRSTVFPSGTKEHTQFNKNVSSEWGEKRHDSGGLQLQETVTGVHIYVCIFVTVHDIKGLTSEFVLTAVDVKYLGSVVYKVAILSGLHCLLQKAKNLKLPGIAEEKSTQGI